MKTLKPDLSHLTQKLDSRITSGKSPPPGAICKSLLKSINGIVSTWNLIASLNSASGSISRSRSCKLKTETDRALEFKRMGGGPGRYTSDIQFFDLYPKTYCRPQSHIISMMGWMATIRSATRFTRFHSCSFISRSSEKGTT